MKKVKQIKEKNTSKKKKEILLEVSLSINKELYNENKISYKMYKWAEEKILKELKEMKGEKNGFI